MSTSPLPPTPSDAELERASYEAFLDAYPTYPTTARIDHVRATEFQRLEDLRLVYLDYTGGGLYPASVIAAHAEFLTTHVLGNPHSVNPASALSGSLIERCRAHILTFFNASPDEYAVVFTANASHALKLVGEAYPFASGDQLLLTFDNHNSVNGIREFDRAHGARTTYVPVTPPDLRVDDARIARLLEELPDQASAGGHHLFAYPAQSNFSGVQHPLEWIALAQARGWDVLLDAAAFVPTNRLDLSQVHPDYVALSFYKMFGHPTGVGCLIAKRDALAKLHRPWFSGGTITVASVQGDRHFLADGAAAFEDGTLDYSNIPAVDAGLTFLEGIGLDLIHERVRCLTGWLLDRLGSLRHENGSPLVTVFGPLTTERRGATVAFSMHDGDGTVLSHTALESSAAESGIALRTGCFCNPGAGEVALGLSPGELDRCLAASGDRMTKDDFGHCLDGGESPGAVRVSLGLASTFADVHTFVLFLRRFLR
jgi:selenocysteine lyase/cysteine desulfurase